MNNRYALYDYNTSKPAQEATKAIDKMILDFADAFKKLKSKFPNIGIGDTATDEMIASVLYQVIHFNDDISTL